MTLKETIEAYIFAAGKGVNFDELKSIFQFQNTDEEITAAVNDLKNDYSGDKGIILIEYDGKFEFQSNPIYGDLLAETLMKTKEKALSVSLMETLAIIAYNQPLTRANIEEIRTKSPDYAMSVLLDHNLITCVGYKDVLGRPKLYGTTEEFLRKFRLKSLADLPDAAILMNSIRNSLNKIYREDSDNLFRGKTREDEELEKHNASKNEAAADSDTDDGTPPDFVFEDSDEDDDFLKGDDIVVVD